MGGRCLGFRYAPGRHCKRRPSTGGRSFWPSQRGSSPPNSGNTVSRAPSAHQQSARRTMTHVTNTNMVTFLAGRRRVEVTESEVAGGAVSLLSLSLSLCMRRLPQLTAQVPPVVPSAARAMDGEWRWSNGPMCGMCVAQRKPPPRCAQGRGGSPRTQRAPY